MRTDNPGRSKVKGELLALGQPGISFSVQVALVFAVSGAVFLLLRTSDYLAVDGAIRALQVYQLGRPFVHPNNHLLYPFNVYAFTTVLRFLGFPLNDPFSFLGAAQAMNAVAAAGFLTMVYGVTFKVTNRAALAALVTVGYASSRAFIAHATNSAEPMVGLLWSGISIMLALFGISHPQRGWVAIVAGFCLALAMATYQSMLFLGVPIVFLMYRSLGRAGTDGNRRAPLFSILGFIFAVVFGIVAIFGAAYYFDGTRTASGMAHRFAHVEPALEHDGGLNLTKAASVLPGLAYALFPCLPRECTGFRCFSAGDHRSWIPVTAFAVALAGGWLLAILFFTKRLWKRVNETEKLAITICGVGLISTAVPLAWYMPTYDKLWLQPLACLFVGSGILLSVFLKSAAISFEPIRCPVRWGYALVALVVLSNVVRIAWVGPGSGSSLREAREVANLVKQEDLLVGDWNDVFLLYQAFWSERGNSFNVTTETTHDGMTTLGNLARAAANTKETGGIVFFLGLLDTPPREWNLSFEGNGLPYDAFSEYRRCAQPVKVFSYHGRQLSLRRLGPCAGQVTPSVRTPMFASKASE